MKTYVFSTAIFLITAVLISCSRESGIKAEYRLIANKNIVSYAKRFAIHRTDSCTIVRILNPWQGADNVENIYYLVKRGFNISVPDTSAVIYVPVQKIVCMSTTHLAMIKSLGAEHSIKGVSGSEFIYDSILSRNARDGLIKDVGYESSLNNELILNIRPDLVMIYGIGSESAGYVGKIRELGVKIMFNADYLETNPLGKAEWIKLFAALYCKEAIADSIFKSVTDLYLKYKNEITANACYRPKVMLGLPFRDTWYISPGNSYISTLINDAGGEYLWGKSISAVSMPYGLESVYLRSLEADYWLNTGSAVSKRQIPIIDSRLASIPAFIKGNLYNNNKRLSSAGGNDYWESGTINPHLILKDIAAILHPELYVDHELYYYRKIE